jgi:superfamily II helicase
MHTWLEPQGFLSMAGRAGGRQKELAVATA